MTNEQLMRNNQYIMDPYSVFSPLTVFAFSTFVICVERVANTRTIMITTAMATLEYVIGI